MRIIGVCQVKGGAGKTISAVSLATTLAKTRKTLLVDGDGQYSATGFFLSDPEPPEKTIYSTLFEDCDVRDAVVSLVDKERNLHLLPSEPRMSSADRMFAMEDGAEYFLGALLDIARKDMGMELCLVDTPGTWGGIVRSVALCATHVIVPINCEKMSYDAAHDTIERMTALAKRAKRRVPRFKILLTAYKDTVATREIVAACYATWPRSIFETRIRATEEVRRLSLDKKTIAQRGASTLREDYQNLTKEVNAWL